MTKLQNVSYTLFFKCYKTLLLYILLKERTKKLDQKKDLAPDKREKKVSERKTNEKVRKGSGNTQRIS